tara:strand:- start:434 stop:562 length:129 start_codon:yes stop_codon:yes gene_type:complete
MLLTAVVVGDHIIVPLVQGISNMVVQVVVHQVILDLHIVVVD